MSEPIVRTPSEQAENITTTPEPEQTTPESAVQAAAAAAADKAAEAEEQAREEAEATAKAVVPAYRKGETAYRAGLLEAGRLADNYLHQRMTLGDKRAAGVQRLEGLLAAWSSSAVDVNRLIGTFHAYHLLAEEPGVKADAVPYGHYRDGWSQLVQRTQKDTPHEQWALLPGAEEDCKATFARCVQDGLSKEAVLEQAKSVVRKYADVQAAATKAAEAEAARIAAEKAEAERKARAEAVQAEQAAQDAKAAVDEAQDADKPRLAEQAEKALADLRAKQQAAIVATEEKAQAERVKARQEAEAKAAEEAQRRAAERAAKAAQTAAERAAAKANRIKAGGDKPKATMAHNLLASAKQGTAKDVAGMAAELVTGSEAPDDVLTELLAMLKASAELSAKAKRACDAALVILRRSPVTNPVAVAGALAPVNSNPMLLAAVA